MPSQRRSWSGGRVQGVPNAHEDTQIPASPSWICSVSTTILSGPSGSRLRTLVALAIGAALVALELHECLESLTVLLCSISSGIGPPRHCGVLSWPLVGEGVGRIC